MMVEEDLSEEAAFEEKRESLRPRISVTGVEGPVSAKVLRQKCQLWLSNRKAAHRSR